ncbi:MAG: AbrB/MazE/SpoVT family DNA-binding domain-containing protein [Lentisphaerae bacterium]|jgi:antitoxin component of MazEF toxin-antitoxin module|nr:AbrB/MazE/SpoVT family DNA-binding domain-containing protein [Lentisphaerota bacterium]
MKTKLISVGDSYRIEIPNPIIEKCGLKDQVEMVVQGSAILIRAPQKKVRSGWECAFSAMAKVGDDTLPDFTDQENSWDNEEWVWE